VHSGTVGVGTEMPVAAEEQVLTLSTASGGPRRRRRDWGRIAGPEPELVSTAGAVNCLRWLVLAVAFDEGERDLGDVFPAAVEHE
jgi:hypothetical protein